MEKMKTGVGEETGSASESNSKAGEKILPSSVTGSQQSRRHGELVCFWCGSSADWRLLLVFFRANLDVLRRWMVHGYRRQAGRQPSFVLLSNKKNSKRAPRPLASALKASDSGNQAA